MALLVKVLGLLAEDAYHPGALGYPILETRLAPGGWNGFQAVAYLLGSGVVIAFRGTELGKDGRRGDLLADAALGAGANSDYFAKGERFVQDMQGTSRRIAALCGHSLGGAIAQVVANRMNLPMVSFNAPGVGVVASRNLPQASPTLTQVRLGGMLASAVVYPGQAISDMKAAFRPVRGLNVRLDADQISQIGLHYGAVRTVPNTTAEALEAAGHIDKGLGTIERRFAAHGITVVNRVLKTTAIGEEAVPT